MITADALADLAPWQIYLHDRHWPAGPDAVFLPSLVSDAMWTRHGIPGCHAVEEDETRTYRDFIAGDIADLIMEGSLELSCLPVHGGEWRTLTELDLTAQTVQIAIATGTIILGEAKRRTKHWVFCGSAECGILLPILEHESGRGDEAALLERLSLITRGNLSRIAGRRLQAGAEGGGKRIISLLLPSFKPRLGPDDRAKLVRAGAGWLEEQFEDEERGELLKDGFRDLALSEFAPFMTKRIFNDMWAQAAGDDRRRGGRRKTRPPKAR